MTIYETADGRRWARPTAMFNEVSRDGTCRFEPLEDTKYRIESGATELFSEETI